jgi:hypothetical protein
MKADPILTVTKPKFKPITMTLIDPTYPNATRKLVRFLRRSGFNEDKAYKLAMKGGGANKSYLDTIGDVEIHQLDEQGRTTEKWTLNRAYAAEVDFGSLDYSSNDPVEITVKLGYKSFRVDFGMDASVPPIGKEKKYDYFRDVDGAKGAGPDNETPAECKKRVGDEYDKFPADSATRINYKSKDAYVAPRCPAAPAEK